MSHETYANLASGYALGALDGEDLALFQTHLAEECAECSVAVRAAEEALVMLARETSPVDPPPSVKQALMARLAVGSRSAPVTPSPRAVPARPWWFPWVAGAVAVCFAAFFTGMFVAARYEARLGQMAREAAALSARFRQQETALLRERDAGHQVLALLRDPTTRVATMRGLGPVPAATGRVIWSEKSGGYVSVSSLPPLPPDKTYELWTISGGTPRPAGLLAVDASGQGGQRVEPVTDGRPVDVFAVTIEPAGGTLAPTGPIVLASR